MEGSYVYVDIETNGGSGERGRIIEVAAIKVIDGEQCDSYSSLVNPGTDIPYWITRLTGISSTDLEQAPYFSDIAAGLFDFMEGSIFVAHNVLFDYSFLKREFAASGYAFHPKLFCTVKMSRALFPEHRGHSLQKIIDRHHLVATHRHRAYDDARAMLDYVRLAIEQKGIDAFTANLALQLRTRTLPPNVDEESILALPDSAGIYIFEDDNGVPLYVGKSVNIRSRVRSHFTNATSIAKEMKMSLHSHNVTYVETESEVEALLLESAKVKELQPIYNRLLRRKTTQAILVKTDSDAGYESFHVEQHDLANYNDLASVYGVFSTKAQAKAKMEEIARAYQLCPKLLGLEKSSGACFRYQLGLCKGACIGREPTETYNARVEYALSRTKIENWPYSGKIAVAISSVRAMIIDQWIPQGIYNSVTEEFSALDNSFDIDSYKIIRGFIRREHPMITSWNV